MEFLDDVLRQQRSRETDHDDSIRRTARRPTRGVHHTRKQAAPSSAAVRALNFASTASSDSRRSLASTSASFYGSRSRAPLDDDFQWQPGQTLPLPPTHSPPVYASESPENSSGNRRQTSEAGNIAQLFQTLQSSLDTKLQTVCDKLTSIDSRMTTLETRQQSLENEVKDSVSPSSSSTAISPTVSGSDKRRKRITPIVLQNRIRTIHNSFESDSQFKPEEPITSTHNTSVIQKIEEAVHDLGFSPDIVRKGCQTYKKTVAARVKSTMTPIKKKKLMRSLKQRAYERRARVVRPGKEQTFWQDITVEVMSDEEKIGDKYVRHAPSYRSEKLNRFLAKLDKRAASKGKSHARFSRECGSPWRQEVPSKAKKWMLNQDFASTPGEETDPKQLQEDNSGEFSGRSDVELFSDETGEDSETF